MLTEGIGLKGSREPNWDEMTDAQKIGHLYQVVCELQTQVNQIGDVVFLLAKHQHLSGGKPCMEIPATGQESYGNPFHRFYRKLDK